MTRWRLPLRLARREVFRRPGRTVLVALLIAIPVAGMTIAVTLIRSEAQTPLEEWQQENGASDAVGFGVDVRLPLPEGSRRVDAQETYLRLKTADGTRADANVNNLPLDDPITEGLYDLVDGRLALADDEAVLTTELADALGVHIGDTLHLARPALDVVVVGAVERTGCLSCHALLLHSDLRALDPASSDLMRTFIDLPDSLSLEELEALELGSGGALRTRELTGLNQYPEANSPDAVRWSLVIGAVVLTVVAIVISAAFAVGARRQLVTLGQLSASGAPASTIRASLVLQGTVTGLVGALGGLFLAAALLWRFEGTAERLLDKRLDGYDVRIVEVLAIVAIGVAAATASALIPARTAARIPTLAALAGRRPLSPVSRRLITWGIVGVVGGLALLFLAVLGSQSGTDGDVWAFVAILGGVSELLGACALSPAIVARLEPLSARFRGALRLGARSLARHRSRTGAVVSAVAAAAALAIVSGALVLAAEQQSNRDAGVPEDVVVLDVHPNDPSAASELEVPDTLRADVLDLLPGAKEVATEATQFIDFDPRGSGLWDAAPADRDTTAFIGSSSDRALVVTDGLLDAIHASDAVRDGLAEHGVVVLAVNGGGDFEGEATIILPDGREVAGASVRHDYIPAYASSFLITADKVDELGLKTSESVVLIEAPSALTAEQRGELDDLRWNLNTEGPLSSAVGYLDLQYQEPRSGPTPLQLELILTGVALVFSLFVVGVSLALAAAESKDERDILTIAGAPPNALARSAGARAWLLSVIGTVMAVPIGFLPVIVVSWATAQNDEGRDPYPIVFPTRTVLLLVVALPLAVCVVSWATSATAQRLRPVRISTATFE